MGKFTKRLRRGAGKQAAQGKISTRLVEFAQPIVDALQDEAGALTQERLRNAYMIAATIWNCQVLEQWGRGSELAERARAELEAMPKTPAFADLVDEMLDRKAEMFPDDMRAISDFDVRRDGKGGFRVVAEGRLARELMDEH